MTTYSSSLPPGAALAMPSIREEVRPGEHRLLERREVLGQVRGVDLDAVRDLAVTLAERAAAQRHRVDGGPERLVDAEAGRLLAQVRPDVRGAQVFDGGAPAVDRVAQVVGDLLQ